MTPTHLRLGIACVALTLLVGAAASDRPVTDSSPLGAERDVRGGNDRKADALQLHYLEFVTPSVKETCDVLAEAHGIEFGEPIAAFGNARTAKLLNRGRIGVRAPMRETEEPIVRPYVLVDDIHAAVKAAEAAGAEVALPPMEIPGEGTFSIFILGGIEHGLWQL